MEYKLKCVKDLHNKLKDFDLYGRKMNLYRFFDWILSQRIQVEKLSEDMVMELSLKEFIKYLKEIPTSEVACAFVYRGNELIHFIEASALYSKRRGSYKSVVHSFKKNKLNTSGRYDLAGLFEDSNTDFIQGVEKLKIFSDCMFITIKYECIQQLKDELVQLKKDRYDARYGVIDSHNENQLRNLAQNKRAIREDKMYDMRKVKVIENIENTFNTKLSEILKKVQESGNMIQAFSIVDRLTHLARMVNRLREYNYFVCKDLEKEIYEQIDIVEKKLAGEPVEEKCYTMHGFGMFPCAFGKMADDEWSPCML